MNIIESVPINRKFSLIPVGRVFKHGERIYLRAAIGHSTIPEIPSGQQRFVGVLLAEGHAYEFRDDEMVQLMCADAIIEPDHDRSAEQP